MRGYFVVLAFFSALSAQADVLNEEQFFLDQDVYEAISSQHIVQAEPEEPCTIEFCYDPVLPCAPRKRWYFDFKPGYYYFTNSEMRHFFDNGGFTFRAEMGYKFWGPLTVWFDGSYFHKSGSALGGSEALDLKLATLTLGFKAICHFNKYIAIYGGAGPRLFLMMLDNDSPFVRGTDNEIGIGGGFDAGFLFFPSPRRPNLFFDLFGDYSWKKMSIDPDEISSNDHDVDLSGVTVGLGLGFRF